VLVLIKLEDNRFVFGRKQGFYPDTIVRFAGGGVKEGESALDAGVREINEELGVGLLKSQLKPLVRVVTEADTTEGFISMVTTVFAVTLPSKTYFLPADDLTGIAELSLQEFEKLIENMMTLSGTFETEAFSFQWRDWGKIYGFIHGVALEEYLKLDRTI